LTIDASGCPAIPLKDQQYSLQNLHMGRSWIGDFCDAAVCTCPANAVVYALTPDLEKWGNAVKVMGALQAVRAKHKSEMEELCRKVRTLKLNQRLVR
jgi:peptidyl-tRNA hydrolase